MAAPTVYRWDDAEAPVARGERDSMVEILTACLVNGYGTKPAAGWTREYVNVDNTMAAFRNNPVTGTGFYLQVDGAGAANAYEPKLQGFETMTSVDIGVGSFTSDGTYKGKLSNGANTTARPWILIADDRFLYFHVWNTSTTLPITASPYPTSLMFGDIITHAPDDAFACILSAGVYVCNVWDPAHTSSAASISELAVARLADGVTGLSSISAIRGGGPVADKGTVGGVGPVWVEGEVILYSRPYVSNHAAYTFRGFLPGFYYPCYKDSFGQLAEVVVDVGVMLSVRGVVGGSYGNWFISLNDWWS